MYLCCHIHLNFINISEILIQDLMCVSCSVAKLCLLLQKIETKTSAAAAAKSLQSCPTQCDPIDGSPPGSLIPGILQARTLEWVAISFSNA